MPDKLSFIVLGVGDAFSARYYSSCLAVHCEGAWLLVDCPHPIRKMMKEAPAAAQVGLDVGSIDALLVTHLHADHSSGIEGFLYFASFVTKGRPRLLAHPDVLSRLWSGHLSAGMERLLPSADGTARVMTLADYGDTTPMTPESPVTIGPFTIECRPTIHHIPTTALRIRGGGRVLGISADTAFDPSLIAWLSEADLFVHETNYGVHTPYAALAALPAETRAKMRLIHYPDDFDTESSVIAPLRQGQRYEV